METRTDPSSDKKEIFLVDVTRDTPFRWMLTAMPGAYSAKQAQNTASSCPIS